MSTRKRYPVIVDFKGHKSLTQQHHKKNADINHIVSKFMKSGTIDPDNINTRTPQYFDSYDSDFRQNMEMVATAKEGFDSLDADIRAFFNNDIRELMDFVINPDNKAECIKMGLIEPLLDNAVVDEHVDSSVDPVEPPAPPDGSEGEVSPSP